MFYDLIRLRNWCWLAGLSLMLVGSSDVMGIEQVQDGFCEASDANGKSSCIATETLEELRLNAHTLSLVRSLHENASTSAETGHSLAVVLLMRHAERPPITAADGPGGLNVLLTDSGKRAAAALGKHLAKSPFVPRKLYSSPVKRCQQTLEQLIDGAGWPQQFEIRRELFGEGHLYTDAKLALQSFAKSPSIKELFRRIVHGEELPGLVPLAKGAPMIVEFMRRELDSMLEQIEPDEQNEHSVSVMLSHDVNLAFLLAHYFGVRDFSGEHWPNFLEAIALVKCKEQYKLIWRDKEIVHASLLS